MTRKPQTAIRGVFSVSLINFLSRLIGFGKHLVIATYIGFTAELDSFFIAMTIVSLAIFSFGDAFDSLGVPRLVQALQRDDNASFRNISGSLIVFSIVLTVVLGSILFVIAPLTPWIAPGFSSERKEFVIKNLLYLTPVILLYLPYHSMGSSLRSRRHFGRFYFGEIIISGVSLLVIYLFYNFKYIIPISVSVSYIVSMLYVVSIVKRDISFRFPNKLIHFKENLRNLFQLFPIYLFGYCFIIIDRIFASYLPIGAVSSLSYGMLIVLIPQSIFMFENIFITPLAETPENEKTIMNIIIGIIIIGVPIASFVFLFAEPIVKVALERGVFTRENTVITSEALSYYGIAIPVFMLNSIFYRFFQIKGRLSPVYVVGTFAIIANVLLNIIAINIGMGVKGIALATTVSNYVGIIGYSIILRRIGIRIFSWETLSLFGISLAISIIALTVASFVPNKFEFLGLVSGGVLFVIITAFLLYLSPNKEISQWKETILREIGRQ